MLQFPEEHSQMGGFEVSVGRHHARINHVLFRQDVLREFLAQSRNVDVQNLEYVPYMRFELANLLQEIAGPGLGAALREMLTDRASGAFTCGIQGLSSDVGDFLRLGTAVSHLIGPANFDSMSGRYYARFLVQDTDSSDSYLRQAYRRFTLHTDGTFVEEPTDYLQMMKFEELNATGGETRLLHLDDWENLGEFARHPFARRPFTYRSPPSKNVAQQVRRPTFFDLAGGPGICFIDQFACPETMEQAAWLRSLSESMESSSSTVTLPLPVGDLIMINNLFWLHGRESFQRHPGLRRELMRQRGTFSA